MPSNTVDANAGSTGADARVAASAAARNARVGVGTGACSMSEGLREARAGEAWRRAAARGGGARRASAGVAVTTNIVRSSGGRSTPAVRCCLFGEVAILIRKNDVDSWRLPADFAGTAESCETAVSF